MEFFPLVISSKLNRSPHQPYELRLTRKQADKRMGADRADGCLRTEVTNIFLEEKAVDPAMVSNVPKSQRIKPLWLNDIYAEKLLPNGFFDKDKRRVVLGEAKQHCTLSDEEKSVPTPSSIAILANTALAKSEGSIITVFDIKSAFLKATVKRLIYARVPKRIVSVLLSLNEQYYRPFVLADGTMWVKIVKALYGSGDASKLWYDLLRSTLQQHNFKAHPYDKCVFFRSYKGSRILINVHIDDFLCMCRTQEATESCAYATLIFRNSRQRWQSSSILLHTSFST